MTHTAVDTFKAHPAHANSSAHSYYHTSPCDRGPNQSERRNKRDEGRLTIDKYTHGSPNSDPIQKSTRLPHSQNLRLEDSGLFWQSERSPYVAFTKEDSRSYTTVHL